MNTDPMWCFENYGEAAEYIDQLEAEKASFYLDYRMKCDDQVKRLEVEKTELITTLRLSLETMRMFDLLEHFQDRKVIENTRKQIIKTLSRVKDKQ